MELIGLFVILGLLLAMLGFSLLVRQAVETNLRDDPESNESL